jgi:hypothetical protein
MKPEDTLLFSLELPTDACPELGEPNPHPLTIFPPFSHYLIYTQLFRVVSHFQAFQPKFYTIFSSSQAHYSCPIRFIPRDVNHPNV